MKQWKRFTTLSFVLVMLMSLVGVASAQDDVCYGLDEDDCELYYDLTENAALPQSSAFELITETEVEADGEEIEFEISVTGAYTVDEDAAEEAVEEFGETSVLDVSLQSFLDLASGSVSAFDAELSIDYALPPEAGIPAVGPIELYLVDGVGYFDFAPLALLDPSLEGVWGVNLFDVIEVALEDVLVGDLLDQIDLDDFEDMDFGIDPETGQLDFGQNTVIEPADLEAAISVERADDSEVDGTDVAVFVTTIDLAELVTLEAFTEAFFTGFESAGDEADFTQEELADALADAVGDSTVILTQSFDTETAYVLAAETVVDLTLDTEPLADIFDGTDEGEIEATVTSTFTRSDVDSIDAIELPEDAEELSAEELFALLFGGF